MPSSNICWGIEIGAGAIKAVKLEAAGGGAVNVLDFVVLPHKKVLSTPDLNQNDALRVALGAFTSQYDLTGTSIAVSVPGHSAFARFAKLPPVEPKKVPDIVKFEAVQQIPFPIDDVEWDYQTFVSPDSPDVEVGIFAITRDRIMERLALYQEVDLVPDYVTLSPVAAYNALAYDLAFTEKTEGTIILDIGTTSTDLIVAEAGRVWIRTFPIGGHHFTEALVKAFQLSYPKAEKLKKEAESTKHARHVFQAMRPVFGDLAQDVQRSIGYYQSLHKDAKLSRLIGIGSTFRLPGLRKFLRQQLGLDVFRMEQFKRLTLDDARTPELQAASLNLVTAYGLALQGIGMAALEANLMPVHVLKDAMWARKVKWFGVAAGVAVAAAGTMFIRPFIDRTAIADNPRPAVVPETINLVRQLKTDAAPVTAAAGQGFPAADMNALLENRGVIAQIEDDVSRMLEVAEAKSAKPPEGKPAQPAFIVKHLKTDFIPPISPNDASIAQGITPKPEDLIPKIRVYLEVRTTQPDALKFTLTTLQDWLQQNKDKERPGVPYKIVVDPASVVKQLFSETIQSPEDSRDEQAGPAERERGGRRGAGGNTEPGTAKRGGPALDPRADPTTGIIGPYQITGSGGPAAAPDSAAQKAEETRIVSLVELKKLAPLPGAPAPEKGTKIVTFGVTWQVWMLPPKPKEGGGS